MHGDTNGDVATGASVKRLINLCRAFMSKDGSTVIYLASEEPVRGKFIVSSAFAAAAASLSFSLSVFLSPLPPLSLFLALPMGGGKRGGLSINSFQL